MTPEVHQARLSRFRRGYRDVVDRSVRMDTFGQRRKITDWCVDNWPEPSYLTRYGTHEELRAKYRQEFGAIWSIILGALLSAVISALIDHWFSDNVRMGL